MRLGKNLEFGIGNTMSTGDQSGGLFSTSDFHCPSLLISELHIFILTHLIYKPVNLPLASRELTVS